MPNLSGKWTQTQVLSAGIAWYKTPDAPTSVSATNGNTQSVVSFTAPTFTGIPAGITGYRVTATVQAGRTIPVTVVNAGSGNKYNMDGSAQPTLTLIKGYTYIFDQADSSNAGHPFRFSTTSDGTHGSGAEYTTGVTTSGTPGSAGAYTQIVVPADAPTLYYYCSVHSGMGGTSNTSTFNYEVTGSSSPITVTGLTNGTTYNITVEAQNAAGYSPAGTTTAAPVLPSDAIYDVPGTYTWVAPSNLAPVSVSVVTIGAGGGSGSYGGGGGGGGLGYKNNISVSGGSSYTVVVGLGSPVLSNTSQPYAGDSYFVSSGTVKGGGGQTGASNGSSSYGGSGGAGGTYTGDGGGNGGLGGTGAGRSSYWNSAGAGGTGGYAGNGGQGGDSGQTYGNNGSSGSGGGGGGGGGGADSTGTGYGSGGGGGGTGIFGQGSSGAAGTGRISTTPTYPGTGGAGGSSGGDGSDGFSNYGDFTDANGGAIMSGSTTPPGGSGGQYGGGGGNPYRQGSSGAVRIVWSRSSQTRTFPSTNVGP